MRNRRSEEEREEGDMKNEHGTLFGAVVEYVACARACTYTSRRLSRNSIVVRRNDGADILAEVRESVGLCVVCRVVEFTRVYVEC